MVRHIFQTCSCQPCALRISVKIRAILMSTEQRDTRDPIRKTMNKIHTLPRAQTRDEEKAQTQYRGGLNAIITIMSSRRRWCPDQRERTGQEGLLTNGSTVRLYARIFTTALNPRAFGARRIRRDHILQLDKLYNRHYLFGVRDAWFPFRRTPAPAPTHTHYYSISLRCAAEAQRARCASRFGNKTVCIYRA